MNKKIFTMMLFGIFLLSSIFAVSISAEMEDTNKKVINDTAIVKGKILNRFDEPCVTSGIFIRVITDGAFLSYHLPQRYFDGSGGFQFTLTDCYIGEEIELYAFRSPKLIPGVELDSSNHVFITLEAGKITEINEDFVLNHTPGGVKDKIFDYFLFYKVYIRILNIIDL